MNNGSESRKTPNVSVGTQATVASAAIAALPELNPRRRWPKYHAPIAVAHRNPTFANTNTAAFAGNAGNSRHSMASSSG